MTLYRKVTDSVTMDLRTGEIIDVYEPVEFGDKPLYEIADFEHTHMGDNPMAAAMCLRCMIDLHISDGELVQVWPEGS